MLTLLGSFLGLLGSFVPEILKHLRDRFDKQHELALLDRQMELMKTNHHQRLQAIDALGDIYEAQVLYNHARPTRIPWVDALSGSVRPVITYVFFLLYGSVKVAQGFLLAHGVPVAQILVHLWHPEDQALFAAVMSFWFGQRSLLKFRRMV